MSEEEKNDNKKDAPKADNNLITYIKKSADDE